MSKIYNIKYIDAYYIDSSYGHNKKLKKTKLFLHEAFGYLKKNGNNIIVTFIKENEVNNKDKKDRKKDIIKGLVLPNTAIVSLSSTSKINITKKIPVGSCVAVNWRDMVFVANQPRYDCSVMYTEGILFRVEKDHIVLKNPETIRAYPKPIVNHPAEKPIFYVIPKSFITDITIIK